MEGLGFHDDDLFYGLIHGLGRSGHFVKLYPRIDSLLAEEKAIGQTAAPILMGPCNSDPCNNDPCNGGPRC